MDTVDWFPEGDPLPCPECKAAVARLDWGDVEVPCDDCGSHSGIECPRCGEKFDHVFGPRRFEGYEHPWSDRLDFAPAP